MRAFRKERKRKEKKPPDWTACRCLCLQPCPGEKRSLPADLANCSATLTPLRKKEGKEEGEKNEATARAIDPFCCLSSCFFRSTPSCGQGREEKKKRKKEGCVRPPAPNGPQHGPAGCRFDGRRGVAGERRFLETRGTGCALRFPGARPEREKREKGTFWPPASWTCGIVNRAPIRPRKKRERDPGIA